MGCALAFDLSSLGEDVIVLERGAVCSGSSGRNAGGVRHQFSSEVNVRVASRSIERISTFEERFGVDVGFQRAGYLFLVCDSQTEEVFRKAVALQVRCGVPCRFLDVGDVGDLAPGARLEDVRGAAYCPLDGYLDPHSLVSGFAAAARRNGATILQGTPVTGFERRGDRILSVVTDGGDKFCGRVVVNAAGAWAPSIARLYGSDFPIIPWRSQVFSVGEVPDLDPESPMTIDFDNGKTYFHPEGGGLLAGTDNGSPADPTTEVSLDPSVAPTLVERLAHRMPALAEARLTGGWAGLLEITADENPLVGWTEIENVYVAAGFSGHGLSIAPGLSAEVALELTRGSADLTLDAYRPCRFAGEGPAPEALSLR